MDVSPFTISAFVVRIKLVVGTPDYNVTLDGVVIDKIDGETAMNADSDRFGVALIALSNIPDDEHTVSITNAHLTDGHQFLDVDYIIFEASTGDRDKGNAVLKAEGTMLDDANLDHWSYLPQEAWSINVADPGDFAGSTGQ